MVRRILVACAAAAATFGSLSSFAETGPAEKRPYTLEDSLVLEATGGGIACGERIIWEQAPPYDQLGQYWYDTTGAWGEAGFKLQMIDSDSREATPSLLLRADPETTYRVDSCSPDGRYVAFFGAKNGKFFTGAYDIKRKHLKTFDVAPVVNYQNRSESVWTSPREFVFAAYELGDQPVVAARRHISRRLLEEREKAWSGKLSVSIDTSGFVDGTPNWAPGRLFKANAHTGEIELLADGLYRSLKVSADGRYLAALHQAKPHQADPDKPNIDWVRSRSQLVVFDLQKGGPARIVAAEKDVFPETLAWAPDEPQLAFFAWELGEGVQSGIYYALDAATGAVTPYPHNGLDLASERERGFAQKPERVMWVDGRLAVSARKHESVEPRLTYRDMIAPGRPDYPGKADWFLLDAAGRSENLTALFEVVSSIPIHADAETITVLADGDAWRVAPGSAPVNLTAEVEGALSHPDAVRYSTRHRSFGSEAILVGRDVEIPSFTLIDLETGVAREVASPAPDAAFLAGSVKSGAVLFRHDHENGTDLILKYSDHHEVIIDRLNGHLSDVFLADWTPITYQVDSHLGERDLVGCLLMPREYEPGKRYPVIVNVYPGRRGSCTRPSMRKVALGRRIVPDGNQLLAAKGYMVFSPNTSREMIRTKEGPVAGMPDIVSQGVDVLIEQGYADPNRIGLYGVSQGGFSSLWVASQTARFKAVVSMNGWADMYSHYFEAPYLLKFYSDFFAFRGSAGRYESTAGTDFGIGKTPYEDPDIYIRQSPLFHAPSITSPILLIHSDLDMFTLAQYERMFTALNLQRKEAKFLRYWGEGHSPSSPENLRHMWSEIFEWYDTYLGGSESSASLP